MSAADQQSEQSDGPPAGAVDVSVVIAARNEGTEIAACVRSVRWAREIVVIENDSIDDTVAQARGAGALVFSHPFRTIGAQRNAAITRATRSWVLVLDADERATPALGAEVAGLVTLDASGDTTPGPRAYRATRRNYFLGREIRHGGWERDRPVRLFAASLRYDERPVHEHIIVDGPVGLLREPMLHTPYATLDEYFEKLRRYSRDWAEQHWASGRRARLSDLLLRPVWRVISMLVLRNGWRDGGHGVVLSVLAGMSVAAKYGQLWALERRGVNRAPAVMTDGDESARPGGARGAPPETPR